MHGSVNRQLSLVIPTHNMGEYTVQNLTAVRVQDLYNHLQEIIIVDDGSTDGTMALLSLWKSNNDNRNILRVVSLVENKGRFDARWEGAKTCRSSHILFVDARVFLQAESGTALLADFANENCIMPSYKIDEKKNIFNLYWLRSHQVLFKKSWNAGYHVTRENYHQYVVGTGCIVVPRQEFLDACQAYAGQNLISDDTELLYELTKSTPIYRSPNFYVFWEPRQNWWDFLVYFLDHRGLSFADYHVFRRWGLFSYLFFLGAGGVVSLFVCFITAPKVALTLASIGLAVLILSTALFAHSVSEFIKMIPIHVASVTCYGFGALIGVFRLSFRKLIVR